MGMSPIGGETHRRLLSGWTFCGPSTTKEPRRPCRYFCV